MTWRVRFLTYVTVGLVAYALGTLTEPARGQTLTFESTAYCCIGVGGGYCGATASGAQVTPGQVAADWRVLPRGTQLFVEGYGPAVVTDTGGDIKGNRIDVFFWDCRDAYQWGRRPAQVSRLTAAPAAPLVPAWEEHLEEVTYWDVDAWVTKRVTDSDRGIRTTYEVHSA